MYVCPDAFVVHASGPGQLQTSPPVADLRLSAGKPTRRMVTTMECNDLVVGEDHLQGPSCQLYNWQSGKLDCLGIVAFLLQHAEIFYLFLRG